MGTLSVLLGIWPDIGALMLAAWVVTTALLIHKFWTLEDEGERMSEQMNFVRNVTYLGGALALFAVFASLGEGLRFAITEPLIQF